MGNGAKASAASKRRNRVFRMKKWPKKASSSSFLRRVRRIGPTRFPPSVVEVRSSAPAGLHGPGILSREDTEASPYPPKRGYPPPFRTAIVGGCNATSPSMIRAIRTRAGRRPAQRSVEADLAEGLTPWSLARSKRPGLRRGVEIVRTDATERVQKGSTLMTHSRHSLRLLCAALLASVAISAHAAPHTI